MIQRLCGRYGRRLRTAVESPVPVWLQPRAGESMASPTSAQDLEAASCDDVLLQVKGLTMHFPLPRWFYQPRVVVRAVDGIDLSVRRGET